MHDKLDVDRILENLHPIPEAGHEVQAFGDIVPMPIALDRSVCEESVRHLNQVLADTITLRDLYKKHHWQVAGPWFRELHKLFDKHAGELDAIIDSVAERIQMLGGVSYAMGRDAAEHTLLPAPPLGREDAKTQIARLLQAHEILLREARTMARLAADHGDDGTNDLLVSEIIRTHERQVWFVSQHIA